MIAEKLKEAGYPVVRDLLYVVAVECLQAANGEVAKAVPPFLLRLREGNDLLLELVRPMLSSIATDYLKLRSEEMKSGVVASGGQSSRARQGHSHTAADLNAGSEGHHRPALNAGQMPSADTSGAEWDGDRAKAVLPQGLSSPAPPSQPIANGEGQGRGVDSDHRKHANPVREPPVTPTEAGRVLQKARPPGAGALGPAAYEDRIAIRGESWLMTYAIPGGPQVLTLTWDDADAMKTRMIREGGERLLAGVVLAALRIEQDKLGRVAGHQVIGKTLTPAAIAKVAEEWEPAKALGKARAWLKQYPALEMTDAT